jgi:SAM-dependent methyltransferase
MELITAESFRFFRGALGASRRVLEVGCGDGLLALALAGAGHSVTALDIELRGASPDGAVTFVERPFLDYRGGPFDAVIFNGSLHHLFPLDAALSHARSLLVAGGQLVADEFAWEAADDPTARWYFELRQGVAGHGHHSRKLVHGSDQDPPLQRWVAEHQHHPPLHTGAAMVEAVRGSWGAVEVETGPYLYRYVARGLAGGDADALLAEERTRIAQGAIRPVGLRIRAISP